MVYVIINTITYFMIIQISSKKDFTLLKYSTIKFCYIIVYTFELINFIIMPIILFR